MLISPSHRDQTRWYPATAYVELANQIADALSATRVVSSVVACGSLVKGDIIPGWSDLDLIVFLEPDTDPLVALESARISILRARGDIEIGIGFDVVGHDDFLQSKGRIGGRPLAMSYEVARYGRALMGVNPFHSVDLEIPDAEQIGRERVANVRAELHNWRRDYLEGSYTNATPRALAHATKTLLKLLKHETAPDPAPPFTYEAALSYLRVDAATHSADEAFAAAVRTRRDWNMLTDTDTVFRTLVGALSRYPWPTRQSHE